MIDNKLTLRDLGSKHGSLFGEINKIEPYPFINENGSDFLDLMLFTQYGDRQLFKSITPLTIPQIAKFLVMAYGDRWQGLVDMAVLNLDLGASEVVRSEEFIVTDETRNNTQNRVNKVSAYNSPDLIINDGDENTGVDDLKGAQTKVFDSSTHSINTAYNNLLTLEKTAIINVVLRDITEYTTLSIY